MAHQVFLSHAREDQAAASRICALLETEGIVCWLPSRDAAGSKDKAAANLQAIRSADLVLLVFSASANASTAVLRQIERAVAYERPVLSIHLDEASPNASLEFYLNLWQWLDVSSGMEDRRDDIVAAVREHLAGIAGSRTWRWLDAPGGVDGKHEEIVATVRRHLPQTSALTPARATAATRRRPGRRGWMIIAGTAIVAVALGLGLGLGLSGTDSQGRWTRLYPEGTVPHAPTAPIVYDSVAGRPTLMVSTGDDIDVVSAIGTWAYDPVANTWLELKPTGTVSPPRIGDPAMTYDPTTRRLIMFGGADQPSTELPEGGFVNHPTAGTWAFDTVTNAWIELKPSGMEPPDRQEGATAFDPGTGRVILFGGVSADAALGDTWAYDPAANTWTELWPKGTVPSARSSKMVYDPTTRRIILFGGATQDEVVNDIWAYDPSANTWTALTPSGTPPERRLGCALAYDSSSHRVIVFGGANADSSTFFNDTWAYDPVANTWTELKPSGELPRACYASMVYDVTAERLIMFAEGGPGASLNDIWALTF